MILGAITGVPTPACLSTTSNPVEAVTPPLWCVRTVPDPVWIKEQCSRRAMQTALPKNFT